MSRLLLIAVFLEVGAVLIVAPWTGFWDRNYFAEWLPPVQAVIGNHYVRGAVSGLGVINVFAGLAELASLIMVNRAEAPPSIVAPSAGPEE